MGNSSTATNHASSPAEADTGLTMIDPSAQVLDSDQRHGSISNKSMGRAGALRSVTKSLQAVCVGLDRAIAGEHPDGTIFHPQWLAIRAQRAGIASAARHVRGVLVDVGCGRKPFERILLPRTSTYIGLDHPQTAEPLGGSRADLFGTVTRLPLSGESVDTMVLTEVLEHVPDPPAILAELHRVLKPHGTLILTAPMIYNIHGSPDFFRFTPEGLRYLLTQAGFRVVALRSQGYAGTMLGVMINNFLTVSLDRNRFLRLLRWTVLLPLVPLVFAAVNVLGAGLDWLVHETRFSFNHLAIATRAV